MVRVIRSDDDGDDGEAVDLAAVITAPATVSVILSCPHCDEPSTVVARLFARVTKDSDGTGALVLRTKAAKVGHICDQLPLGLVEGPRVR